MKGPKNTGYVNCNSGLIVNAQLCFNPSWQGTRDITAPPFLFPPLGSRNFLFCTNSFLWRVFLLRASYELTYPSSPEDTTFTIPSTTCYSSHEPMPLGSTTSAQQWSGHQWQSWKSTQFSLRTKWIQDQYFFSGRTESGDATAPTPRGNRMFQPPFGSAGSHRAFGCSDLPPLLKK